MTARVTSLTGVTAAGGRVAVANGSLTTQVGLQPWARPKRVS